jgi:granule-bound starch synthase
MGLFDPDELVDEDAEAIAETMIRAAATVGTPVYTEMSKNCIKQDLSWAKPAQKWEGILEEVMSSLLKNPGSCEGR